MKSQDMVIYQPISRCSPSPVHAQELFSNPIAPPDHEAAPAAPLDKKAMANLTNEDFRKLLMTPRPTPSSASAVNPASLPYTQEKCVCTLLAELNSPLFF